MYVDYIHLSDRPLHLLRAPLITKSHCCAWDLVAHARTTISLGFFQHESSTKYIFIHHLPTATPRDPVQLSTVGPNTLYNRLPMWMEGGGWIEEGGLLAVPRFLLPSCLGGRPWTGLTWASALSLPSEVSTLRFLSTPCTKEGCKKSRAPAAKQ